MTTDAPSTRLDDGLTIGCGTLLGMLVMAPLLWLVAAHFAQPAPAVDGRAVYEQGALAMCRTIAAQAQIPASEAAPMCESMSADVAGSYAAP